jgi:hypothetical protein
MRKAHNRVEPPSEAAELCGIVLVLWQYWAQHYAIPDDLLTVKTECGEASLMALTDQAIRAFAHQHGDAARTVTEG